MQLHRFGRAPRTRAAALVSLPLFVGALLLWLGAGCSPRPKPNTQAAAVAPTGTVSATNQEPLQFVVSFPESARSQPVTGRVLLFLTRNRATEPRRASDFFNLEPVYAIDATNLAPGQKLTFAPRDFSAPDALAFPGPLSRLEPGAYFAQALIDVDNTARDFNAGPGNLYSKVVSCHLQGSRGGTVELEADQVIRVDPPKDNDWVKVISVRSERLSQFHGREVQLQAAVILPSSYQLKPERRYPTLYVVPGFGGRHGSAFGWINSESGRQWKAGEVPLQMIQVVLDPDVPLGHSGFANSANNGPVGDALVRELIPEIEKRFRVLAEPWARFVSGHSSGGWSSLWLQVAYPDDFGGCWSTAPDPVDFRAFQTMNLYADRNGHWTREGLPRPLARRGDKVAMTFSQLNRWEYVTGYGSQLDSFNAVFSPRGSDGRPRPVMDKLSGALDPDVVESWKRYDIRLWLEDHWASLGPKLHGKLHVIAASWDTFYLDPAVVYLRDFLRTTDYGGYVEILPGDHGSAITRPVRDRIAKEMAQAFEEGRRKHAPNTPSPNASESIASSPDPGRCPKDDLELRYWLENMVWHHRFSTGEIQAATGLNPEAIADALRRFDISDRTRPAPPENGSLKVMPYPGGRHPRIGFLEGAIRPQRETKISVFTPWDESSYVVADIPEALWSNLGLTYLAHTHIDTVWTKQGIELPVLEWSRLPDDRLEMERTLPNGIRFGTKVIPGRDAVRMDMWLVNGTTYTLKDLRVQNCVMLKGARGSNQQTNANKVLTSPFAACRSEDGRRWIISAWEPCHRPWANPPVPCLHSDPKFPDCPPGQTRRLKGWLSFYEGADIQVEFDRIRKDPWWQP